MRFLLTLVLAITTGVMAKASDFVVDSIHYNVLSAADKTVEVTYANDYQYKGDIVIPATVKMGTKELKVVAVGPDAFAYCSELTSVVFGANVETIGNRAFGACEALKEVSFEGNIKTISDRAFKGCKGLVKVEIPSNVETIGNDAFEACSGIEQLIIHNGVKAIGTGAFSNNAKITEVSIPSSVESLGYSCFYAYPNTGIKVLKIEDGGKDIRFDAPWTYSILDKFYLGRNPVDGLWDWSAINAKEITIGSNVTRLKWASCENLETINLHCTTPPTSNPFTEAQYAMVKVNVPAGSLEAYQKAEPWCNFWSIQDTLPSAIDDVEADKDEVVAIYAIDGTPCTMNDKGVKVVKMKSGKTMKVVK